MQILEQMYRKYIYVLILFSISLELIVDAFDLAAERDLGCNSIENIFFISVLFCDKP